MQKSIFNSFASMAIFALFSCFALSAFAQVPAAPTNLEISTDENGVNLSWDPVTLDNGNIPSYEIAYSPDADTPSDYYGRVQFSEYESQTQSNAVNGIRTANQTYYFFVRTVESPWGYSAWAPFGTPKSDGMEWIVPEAPTNLKFDPTKKLLTWTAPEEEVDGYLIEYGYTNNDDDTYGDETSLTSYPINSTGGKTRYYWVSSYKDLPYPRTGYMSSYSKACGPVQVNVAGLPAPADLKYDSKTQTLSWKPVPGADDYLIYRSETLAGLNGMSWGDDTEDTGIEISTYGRSYFYGVRAAVSSEESIESPMAVYKSRINTQDGVLIKVPTGLDKWDPKDDSYEFATVLKPTSKEQQTEAHSLNEFDNEDYFSIAMKPGNTYEFEVVVTAGAPRLNYDFGGGIYGELTHADSKIKFTYSPAEKETRYLNLYKYSYDSDKMTPVSYTVKYKVTKGTKIEAPTGLKVVKEDKEDEDGDVKFEVTWAPVSGTGVTYDGYLVDDPAKTTGTAWVAKNAYEYVTVYARDASNNYSAYSKPLLLVPAGSTKFGISEKVTASVGKYTTIRAADVDSAKMYFNKPPKFHATDGVSKKKIKVTAMTKFDLKNKEKRPEVDCVFEAPKLYDVKAFKKLYKAGISADSFLIDGNQAFQKTLKVFASGEIDGNKVKNAETKTIYSINAPSFFNDEGYTSWPIERTINGMIYPILIAEQSNFFNVWDIGTKIPKAWLEVKKTKGTKTTITKKSLKVAKLPAKANYTRLQITAPKSFGNDFKDGEYILVIESQSGLITFPVWAGAKEPVQSLKK